MTHCLSQSLYNSGAYNKFHLSFYFFSYFFIIVSSFNYLLLSEKNITIEKAVSSTVDVIIRTPNCPCIVLKKYEEMHISLSNFEHTYTLAL